MYTLPQRLIEDWCKVLANEAFGLAHDVVYGYVPVYNANPQPCFCGVGSLLSLTDIKLDSLETPEYREELQKFLRKRYNYTGLVGDELFTTQYHYSAESFERHEGRPRTVFEQVEYLFEGKKYSREMLIEWIRENVKPEANDDEQWPPTGEFERFVAGRYCPIEEVANV